MTSIRPANEMTRRHDKTSCRRSAVCRKPQRVARPDGCKFTHSVLLRTAGREQFNPAKLGDTLRLRQPRSG